MRQALAEAGIPERLWSIFLPQLEQLEAKPVSSPFGVGGRVELPHIEGWFWGAAIEPDCLVSSMNLTQREDSVLTERPQVSYFALARFTPWDANLMNGLWSTPTIAPLPDENLAAFAMGRGTYDFALKAGSSHGGCTICMLPSFVERELGAESPRVLEAMRRRLDLNRALELRAILRAIRPARALRAGAQPYYRAKVLEALAELTALVDEMDRQQGTGASATDALGDRVRSLLSASMERPPTLDELAATLGLSRTTLCARFREQTGTTIGAYLTKLRMSEAKTRLQNTSASIAEVAEAVGYQSQAAFSTAFKRATGTSPLAWRNDNRVVPRS